MFNLVMGIIMTAIGFVCVIKSISSKAVAIYVFVGCTLFLFGIVEIIRSKKIRNKKKREKNREFDMYMKMASEMGVKINPVTKEIIHEEEKILTEPEAENIKESEN